MKKMSIKTKICVCVLIVSIFCSMMIGFFSLISYKNNLEDYMGKRALDIAQTISTYVDGDIIKKYNQTNLTDDNYEKTKNYLSNIKKNTNLTYLYIMTDAGENFKYIVEGVLDGEEATALGDTESKEIYGSEPTQAMSTGKCVYTKMYDNGEWGKLISGFAPIFDSNNDVVGVVGLDIGADIINDSIYKYLPILFAIMIISCAFSYLTIYVIITKLVLNPIKAFEGVAITLAHGNFNILLPDKYLNKSDEIGNLAQSFAKMAKTLKDITSEISCVLTEIGNMNLNIKIDNEYIGDFNNIKISILKILKELNETFYSITEGSNQVLAGSLQVSNAAQALAQGTTEQASSAEQLSSSIQDIAVQIRHNAKNINIATNHIEKTVEGVTLSNNEMQNMLKAMNEINTTSEQISKINKVIEDIAFQTNILALNAAVEAARAGASGKGFAVVADEVRNLASKSANAAKQTTELIESSKYAVNEGVKIAEYTAKSLDEVSNSIQLVKDMIEKISKASSLQTYSISQINQGIEQISAVIQTNSATAEESAAASEELTAQANMLNSKVERFSLVRIVN